MKIGKEDNTGSPKAHIFTKILVRWLKLGPFAAGQEKAKCKSNSTANLPGMGGDNIQPWDIHRTNSLLCAGSAWPDAPGDLYTW